MRRSFGRSACNTWNANANQNAVWLASPYRRGEDDMGRVYGVAGPIMADARWR